MFIFDRIIMSSVVIDDGVSKPAQMRINMTYFMLYIAKSLLTQMVRRAANILNKHTIHLIVSNLLTTVLIGGFVFAKPRYRQKKQGRMHT